MALPFQNAPVAGGVAPGPERRAPLAPQPPQPAAFVAPHRVVTYRELLTDEANSPTPARLANYLYGYRFDGGAGVPTPSSLRDLTVTLSDRQPMAFLSLTQGPNGAHEVVIVHRFMRYMDMPGEEESGFHDRVLGLQGDILPHQYPTVDLPSTVFHLVGNAVRVPTTDAMVALLPTWENPAVPLGPFTEEDPETEVIRPRHLQLLPGYYASMFIHRRGLTAKVVFQEIYGAMQARNEVVVCADILTWLKAAATSRGGGGLQNTVPSVYHPLTSVHLPQEVYRYLVGKVRMDLPALATNEGESALTGTLAGALHALTRHTAAAGPEDRGPKEPKTIQEVYKETYKLLVRFCNVSHPGEVAPIWSRLANCTKSEQATIIIQEFHRVCMARGLDTALYTPIVTTGVRQMIMGFQFVGYGVDDLGSGCQPFQVAYAGSTHHMESVAAATLANQLTQGEHQASLTDYRTLRDQEKVKFPRDITEVCVTLSRYAVLCQALFQGAGAPNPLVAALWNLTAALNNAAPFITDRIQQVARPPLTTRVYYPTIIRSVQVLVHEYLHAVETNVADTHEGVERLEFRSLVTDLRRGTFHHSGHWVPLPEAYLEPPRSSAGTTTRTAAPSVVSTGSSSTAPTGVSSLTDTTRETVVRTDNPAPDADFTTIITRRGGTRQLLRTRPPPQNDAGLEFCVAWWIRGGCFPNCGRRATHTPFASANERTRLLTYCREHLAAPPTAAGGST